MQAEAASRVGLLQVLDGRATVTRLMRRRLSLFLLPDQG